MSCGQVCPLSGHAYPYVGFLTDHGASFPHMMGIAALGQAVRQACNAARVSIDMLIMDVCNCNHLEVIYEIAAAACPKEHSHDVKSILTDVHKGPLAGIPLDLIAQAVADSRGALATWENIGTRLVKSYSGDLVLVDTSQVRLSEARSHLADLVSECMTLTIRPRSKRFSRPIPKCCPLVPCVEIETNDYIFGHNRC